MSGVLGWLFDGLIDSRKVVDYKIVGVRQAVGKSLVKVKSVGQINGPIAVQRIENGVVAESVWVTP